MKAIDIVSALALSGMVPDIVNPDEKDWLYEWEDDGNPEPFKNIYGLAATVSYYDASDYLLLDRRERWPEEARNKIFFERKVWRALALRHFDIIPTPPGRHGLVSRDEAVEAWNFNVRAYDFKHGDTGDIVNRVWEWEEEAAKEVAAESDSRLWMGLRFEPAPDDRHVNIILEASWSDVSRELARVRTIPKGEGPAENCGWVLRTALALLNRFGLGVGMPSRRELAAIFANEFKFRSVK
jgi:hypothetical protein